jgi:microcystin degradation protein MlrC
MRPVFRRMRALEKDILAASIFMVHPWNDDPALGWSTLAVAEDLKDADRVAEELAELCWQRRLEQPPEFPGASEAIAMARAATVRRRFGCVVMADASDVVTAGAPGDSTHLLKALIEEASGMRVYTAVRDPAAVATLWPRAPGDVVTLTLGKPALPVRGKIVSRHERHGFGKNIVLAVENVSIVITEGPSMVMRPSFYTEVGLDPWRADICVVKNFFPFLMFFLPYNRKTIFVRTHGVTDFDAAFQLPFDGPMHPRDPVDDWRSRDRLRRGLA